jgi:hypothetical protein
MTVLRFYRRPAATDLTLARLAAAVNREVTGVPPVTRIESEYVFYVDVAGAGLDEKG